MGRDEGKPYPSSQIV
ncbi:hypothetical protein A2U01_0058679, partial [Trifolium medium]|nr:hypothetical protein [Trifolium medium]